MLSIKDLHVSVEDKAILRGLSLDVHPGEVHAIMGPNGSCKSTLSAKLAGREDYEVTGGTVEFKGKDLLALSPEDRAGEGIKQRKRQTEKSAQWRRSYYPTAPALDADESASGAESR